jgi:hypothetical protein
MLLPEQHSALSKKTSDRVKEHECLCYCRIKIMNDCLENQINLIFLHSKLKLGLRTMRHNIHDGEHHHVELTELSCP